ncbi:hypothetical protein D0863_08595 [Hortaea werneckii]|uniref:F-box domain-containing protein n=1 Tax=Hortaea werneckii TaxID=91943 RepID=A0A3M7DPR7_HORWE|nr:hypothetical protein D0863_08595 [Hortaea werneckii]
MGDDVATSGQSDLRDDAKGDENDPPFLKLPAELRTIIYRYAAVKDSPIQLYLGDIDRHSEPRFREYDRRPVIINLKSHPHPLALTCRKFYSEVRPIYLLENTFCLSNLTTTENLHVEYIEQFRKMMCPFVKRLKKVNIDYRFCAKDDGRIQQRWVRLTVLLDEGGVLRMETRAGTSANLCYCGLAHLAKNHSSRASDTKLLDLLEAMFNVASGHEAHQNQDILQECRRCGGKRRFKNPRWPQTGKERLVVW